MLSKKQFQILVVLMRDVGLLDGQYYHNFEVKLKKQNIPFARGISDEGELFDIFKYDPDFVFLQTPYYHATKENPFFSNFLWFFTNVIHIPYAYSTDNKFHIKHWDKYDRVIHRAKYNFVESEEHRMLYCKYSKLKDSNVVVMGYPKFDQYLKNWEITDLEWKVKDKSVKRILWTPHYTVTNRKSDYIVSDFLNYFDFFTKRIKDMPQFQIILKPHPYLFRTLIEEKLITTSELNSMISNFLDLDNATIYEGDEYYGLFVTSDICINESISFIAEYLPSGHPMILLVKKNRSPFGDIGEKIAPFHYIAHDTAELDYLLNDILINKNDPKMIQRKNISDVYTKVDYKHSIAEKICFFLQKESEKY